jgi:carbonic anhydrase/acetyltransferase-like protein (isoleucine patch superfamily)
MEDKKYELVKDDFIIHKGKKLYRIRALKKIITSLGANVHRGDIGGYIERYHNLSQEGKCWIFDEAKVYSNASIKDDALVIGKAEVFDNARVKGNARVERNAVIFGNAIMKDHVTVGNYAKVYDNARLEGYTIVCNDTEISGNAVVRGNNEVVVVKGRGKILDNAVLSNCCAYYIEKEGCLCDNSRVHGNNTKSVITLGRKFSNNSIICV